MAPLTSSPSCASCSRLVEKITELEGRISTLYHIQEAEQLLDTITFGPAITITTCTREPDTRLPAATAEVAAPPESSVTAHLRPADSPPPPTSIPDDSWLRLGAKPKALVSSTPFHHESWKLVGGVGRGRGRRSPPASHNYNHNIQLENKYELLNLHDFPPLTAVPQPPSSPPLPSLGSVRFSRSPQLPPPSISHRSPRRVRRSIPLFTPAPRRAPARLSARPYSSTPSPQVRPLPLASPPLSTLIIGDSIVRNIKKPSALTYCFPGAKVTDIMKKIPSILADHPLINTVVLHVGCNDIPKQSSEILKQDFIQLINSLPIHSKKFFISGPLPSLNRGIGRFSRTLSLHTWLKLTCTARNIAFVDNFNLFWKRPAFFQRDGIHPNGLGSRTLTDNLFYSILNSSLH